MGEGRVPGEGRLGRGMYRARTGVGQEGWEAEGVR